MPAKNNSKFVWFNTDHRSYGHWHCVVLLLFESSDLWAWIRLKYIEKRVLIGKALF